MKDSDMTKAQNPFFYCVQSKAVGLLTLSLLTSSVKAGILSFGLGYALGSEDTIRHETKTNTVYEHLGQSGSWSLSQSPWIEIKTKEGNRIPIQKDLISTVLWDADGVAFEYMGKIIPLEASNDQKSWIESWKQSWLKGDDLMEIQGQDETRYLVRSSMILGGIKNKESNAINVMVGSGLFHFMVNDSKLWGHLLSRKMGVSWSLNDVDYWVNPKAIKSIEIKKDQSIKSNDSFFVTFHAGPLTFEMPRESWNNAYQRQWNVLRRTNFENGMDSTGHFDEFGALEKDNKNKHRKSLK